MNLNGGGATWGAWYWPVWLGVAVAAFLGPEIAALVSGRSANTLSAWVWRTLQITRDEAITSWGAADFLTFGVWLVLIIWLTFHFFFGRFT